MHLLSGFDHNAFTGATCWWDERSKKRQRK